MTARSVPVAAILSAGAGMGFAGDQLLRTSGGPGLNFFLLYLGLAASVWLVAQSGEPLGREAWSWIGVGVLCGAALLWRGSGLVRFVTFVAACTAFALPALGAGRAWVRRSGVLDVAEAVVGAGLFSVAGGTRLLQREAWGELGGVGRTVHALTRTAVGGALLALTPLVVFGGLFISADQVFATMAGDFVRFGVESFASHAVSVVVLSWLACGYLVGVSGGTRLDLIRPHLPRRPSLGVPVVATALGLVDLLFLSFVVVQFRYLFGGGLWVEVTPDLTYAAYARDGFFQLVFAVALAIPWLLSTHALVERQGNKARWVFAGLGGVHLVLLLAIVASAIQRMFVYQLAYGLTEERVVATAILVWLTGVVLWFGATVLGGRRHRFAYGALVTGFALVGALQIIDPAGWAARHNLDRGRELGKVDVEHLASLGSDAAPLLVDRIGELPAEARCVVATRLLEVWGPGRSPDWKSYNWSESRAREAVAERLETLRSSAGPGRCG